MKGRRMLCTLLAAAGLLLLCASPAAATFHLIKVREIYAGSSLVPEAKYVELQMYADGQNHVEGHSLRVYGVGGSLLGTSTFGADVANGASQSTVLLASPAAEAEFGLSADAPLANPGALSPAGGAVCWEELDCVSWGEFANALPSPAGPPAPAIPDGMALRRSIAPGCPTLLEAADDSNDSEADFEAVSPAPRPNSTPPSETACAAGGGGAGTVGGGSGPGQPQTRLRRMPPQRTTDRTPTFGFGANEAGVRFQCRIDGKPYRSCRSPFTTRRLAFGRHTFRVRAVDSEGTTDPTPARYRFTVVRPSRR